MKRQSILNSVKHQKEQFYYCSSSHSHCEIFNDVYIFYMKVMWPLVSLVMRYTLLQFFFLTDA